MSTSIAADRRRAAFDAATALRECARETARQEVISESAVLVGLYELLVLRLAADPDVTGAAEYVIDIEQRRRRRAREQRLTRRTEAAREVA